MAFEFYKYKDGADNELFREERVLATSGYALYVGQALKISAGLLIYAQTGDQVYAICGVSAASSVVTAATKPVVFPVNNRQIWKATIATALTLTAATASYIAQYGILGAAATAGTAIDGQTILTLGTACTASPAAFYFVDVVTAGTVASGGIPASGAYVIFPSVV